MYIRMLPANVECTVKRPRVVTLAEQGKEKTPFVSFPHFERHQLVACFYLVTFCLTKYTMAQPLTIAKQVYYIHELLYWLCYLTCMCASTSHNTEPPQKM